MCSLTILLIVFISTIVKYRETVLDKLYFFLTVHCDVHMQKKPTKCTFFNLLAPELFFLILAQLYIKSE